MTTVGGDARPTTSADVEHRAASVSSAAPATPAALAGGFARDGKAVREGVLWSAVYVLLAIGGLALAVVAAFRESSVVTWVVAGVVACWALGAVLATLRLRRDVLPAMTAALALAGGLGSLLDAPLIAIGAGCIALLYVGRRCRHAASIERARLQWLGWGVLVAAAASALAVIVSALTGWPPNLALVVAVCTVVVPCGLVLATIERLLPHAARALATTIVGAGMAIAATGVYGVIVVGIDGMPTDDAQSVIGLSMIAAAVIAVLALPVRRRLEVFANRRVYGDRQSPDVALQTFATRMSRSVPMDELLLQLAETLRKTMQLQRAEIWTGSAGLFDLAVAVPSRPRQRITLGEAERGVAARTPVAGNAWSAIWAPALLEGREHCNIRVASVAHQGELLGLIVAVSGPDAPDLGDDQDRVLSDIARQLGLALHNVRLDNALQASLDELQVRNAELVVSRARIVAAADESRRQIERNLHDGAQQHLVALAVKLGLARQLLDVDPATATTLVEELRDDVQATLTELRELAHGIYPPLLRSRGLPEALVAAANRAVLPTTVSALIDQRFDPDVEAAIYFCCLEAIQNAGKHAGDSASIRVTVDHRDGELCFSVADDGAGFDPDAVAGGHGFVNMTDRLGARGGALTVSSNPGAGTTIAGRLVADPLAG